MDDVTLGTARVRVVAPGGDRDPPEVGSRFDLWGTTDRPAADYGQRVRIRQVVAGLPRADVVLALVLFATKQTFVLTGTFMSGSAGLLSVVSATALTLPLAWRRRAPFGCAAIVAAVIAVDDLLAGWNGAVISFDCSIVAAYSAGAFARQRRAAAALGLLLAANLIDAVGAPGSRAGNVALGVVVFSLTPWLVGQALRRERSRTHQLRILAAELEAERDRQAQVAVEAERGRIARELHDIVAHAISVMAVQADAATKLLRIDPPRAREPLETIQRTARSALAEMRQLVGLLRDGNEEPPLSPQPGIANLQRLVEDTRHSGLYVTLQVTGEVVPLPASHDLAAYRIVQEGLTNVRKHAGPAQACVRIAYEPDRVDVEIRDNGEARQSSGSGGHGLIGIAERVKLLGGELVTGRAEQGGFLLHAQLPLAVDRR
jgi:signal transduction histidine kinase